MRKYINIRFDNIHAGYFFYGQYMGPRRLIGERYGNYVVQFSTLSQAKKAIKAYRKYLEGLGYIKSAQDYSTACYADIGNHSHWHVWKLNELSQSFFYINQ